MKKHSEVEIMREQLKACVTELDAEQKRLLLYAVELLRDDCAAFDALSAAVSLGEIPHTVATAKAYVSAFQSAREGC